MPATTARFANTPKACPKVDRLHQSPESNKNGLWFQQLNGGSGFISHLPSTIATTGSYTKYAGPSAMLPRKHPT
jgi:hypothetical protein